MAIERSRKLMDTLGISLPILLAPMAGAADARLAIAVANAGGLGAIACATLSPAQIREEVARFRAATTAPLNLNFFCHRPQQPTSESLQEWQQLLAPFHRELGLSPPAQSGAGRNPFDDELATLVAELKPEVVSFHFGLPTPEFLARVKAMGALVLSSATTVAEARWLSARGADAVIAQGSEAGGHRGMFLTDDIDSQVGTMALVPQIVDAIDLPVIAAGGIADGRGVAAALLLGASAAQIGSAFLLSPESLVSPAHRRALKDMHDDSTRLTNLFTGRPARGIVNRLMRELGPMNPKAPLFPHATSALSELRRYCIAHERPDFVPLWSGQAGHLAEEAPAEAIARRIAAQASELLGG